MWSYTVPSQKALPRIEDEHRSHLDGFKKRRDRKRHSNGNGSMQGTSRFWVRRGWFAWTGKMEIGATPSTGQEKVGECRGTGTGVCVLCVNALWPSQGLQMIMGQTMMVGVRFCKHCYLGGGRLLVNFFFFFKTDSAFDQLPWGFIIWLPSCLLDHRSLLPELSPFLFPISYAFSAAIPIHQVYRAWEGRQVSVYLRPERSWYLHQSSACFSLRMFVNNQIDRQSRPLMPYGDDGRDSEATAGQYWWYQLSFSRPDQFRVQDAALSFQISRNVTRRHDWRCYRRRIRQGSMVVSPGWKLC